MYSLLLVKTAVFVGAFLPPFFFGGTILTALFSRYRSAIGAMYAADLIAACQVVIDEQTPLAQVSVAEALVVVVEPPPLEPQPAATNTNDAATAMRLCLRMDFIVIPSRSIGRAGACAGPPPAIYEPIAPDTSSWDFAIAFCSSS